MTQSGHQGIAEAIARHAVTRPASPALSIDGEIWSYRELLAAAWRVAECLPARIAGSPQPIVAIMAGRHCSSYLGVLAALLRGYAYVPVNVRHPDSHKIDILRRSGAEQVISGELAAESLRLMLTTASNLPASLQVVCCKDVKPASDQSVISVTHFQSSMTDIAYVMFTSGSTGEPKGVPISYGNLTSYLLAVSSIMDVQASDRCSQTFELTFDLSVHDLLVCWMNGAHLIVPSAEDLANPAAYICDAGISCWFSVPSMAYQIQLQGRLQPGVFPGLRWSLFCGEALPADLAHAWSMAGPNGKVENWYGPTEATIACSRYAYSTHAEIPEDGLGIVPIGVPFPGMAMTILGDDFIEVEAGVPGELFLSGAQVASGYLGDAERSGKSFVSVPGRSELFYRTGDLARRNENGVTCFLGRADSQVKIRGFRVELGAVEAAVRAAIGEACNVVALSWPPGGLGGGGSLVAAIELPDAREDKILAKVRRMLPDYMVPSRIVSLAVFPTNISGKTDRKAIGQILKEIFWRDTSLVDISHLSNQAESLMLAILGVSPHLSSDHVLQASTLIAAGVDSLSFVSLTACLEQHFGLVLQQEDVVALAEMSFREMLEWLQAVTAEKSSGAAVPVARLLPDHGEPVLPYLALRANRVLQFIERFPDALRQLGKEELVLVVGSSGVFRGFMPSVFDDVCRAANEDVRSFNIGLPAVNCAGISSICEYIRDCCQRCGVRLALVVYELDPMHISSLPPAGDINLGPDHFSGVIKSYDDSALDREFGWQIKSAGEGNFDVAVVRQLQRARWEMIRDQEVARAYLGDLPFVSESVGDWLRGAKALGEVSGRLVGFVHPLDPLMAQAAGARWSGTRYASVLDKIRREYPIPIVPWQEFCLEPSDFLNINHVNPWSGSQRLTRQLAEKIYLNPKLDGQV